MTQIMPLFTINHIAILIIVTVSAFIDWRTTKIFNVITFPAALFGIIINYMTGGWEAALMAVAGWVIGVFVMVFPKPQKKIAFGDAKLMAAIGAFLGPGGVLLAFLYFSLIYGVIACYRIGKVTPWKQFFNLFKVLGPQNVGMAKDSMDMGDVMEMAKSKIALGPAIALGTLLSIVLQKQTLAFMGFSGTEVYGYPMILPALMSMIF